MKLSRRGSAGLALIAGLFYAHVAFAVCGDGQLDPSEECDPGGALRIDGNPSLATCTTGGNCFYEFSCCKFNCQFVGQGAPCFDGNACTTNDICNNVGQCAAGGSASAGTPCDDDLYCTVGDVCNSSGTCLSGAGDPCVGLECVSGCNEAEDRCDIDVGASCTEDGNICTDDVCSAEGVCTHPSNSAPCTDDVFCNGADTCGGGSCSVHAGDPCAGGGPCANVCNEAADTCNLLDGTPCDDGLFCTVTDACVSGVCSGSGDPCSGGAECAMTCNDDADDCFDENGSPCVDDGNPCTDDYCDGAGGCIHLANAAPCDDGLSCTSNDTCSGGVCMGDPPPECDDGNPCTVDLCAEPSGECVNLDEPDPVCIAGGIAQLVISNRDDVVGRDKLKWTWKHALDGTPILLEDVGDPLGSTTYDLCVYDTTCPEPCPDPETMSIESLRAHLTIPPSSLWRDLSSKGRFLYKDRNASYGVSVVKVKMGTEPGIGVKPSKTNLDLTAVNDSTFFEMQPRVVVQLSNSEGRCWGTTFETAVRNLPRSFRTRLTKVVVN